MHEAVVPARDVPQHSLPDGGAASDSLHTLFIASGGLQTSEIQEKHRLIKVFFAPGPATGVAQSNW
jgi:hypothetical protein